MAARLAAGRAAISWDEPGSEAEETPGPHAGEPQAATGPGAAWLRVVEDVTGDDDAEEEIFDDPGDFYADAFEVIE
jgi:hypothetical protein